MALNLNTNPAFTGRITLPDANYTYGSSKDETSPGAANGSPYIKARADDIFGFQQAILLAAGITPNGNADTVPVSEYLQGIVEQAMGRASLMIESGGSAADVYLVEQVATNAKPRSLFDTQTISVRLAVTCTGGPVTINPVGLGVTSVKTKEGVDPGVGAISITEPNIFIYDNVNGWFVLVGGEKLLGYAKLSDLKVNGTAGGTFTSGVWQTRTLNTEDIDEGGIVSLAANRFTLAAGTYIIRARAPAYKVDRHKTRLRNITDGADTIMGGNAISANTGATLTDATVIGRFSISATKVFEIQHRCQATFASQGFGIESSFGVDEIYTTVEIIKVG